MKCVYIFNNKYFLLPLNCILLARFVLSPDLSTNEDKIKLWKRASYNVYFMKTINNTIDLRCSYLVRIKSTQYRKRLNESKFIVKNMFRIVVLWAIPWGHFYSYFFVSFLVKAIYYREEKNHTFNFNYRMSPCI